MKIACKHMGCKRTGIANVLIPVFISFFLFSCTVVEVQDPSVELPTTTGIEQTEPAASLPTTKEPQVVNRKIDSANQKAAAIAGVLIATVATVWVVTEFIEEKVVPAVLGLTVAYLLYQASRRSESNEMM